MPARILSLWCPDWPVVAARHRGDVAEAAPVVVLEQGRVLSASCEARAEEITAGLRRRGAEARCPGLVVLDVDPAADARAFEPVARAVESLTPRLVIDRPGVLAFPTRGPSRYFGGDDGLVQRVLDAVHSVGVVDVRVGIADGAFASRLAARRGLVVAPDETPEFLAPWPVGTMGDEAMASVLCRLGLRTLGAFAALPTAAVIARFGPDGLRAHRLAAGEEEHPPALTVPPPDLVEVCELDPPAERVDEAAFAAKALADRLLARLEERGLACTQVVVEAETEHGEHLVRGWRHEGALTPAALAERVRWQLDGWITGGLGERAAAKGGTTGGLTLLRLIPDQVIPASGRQLGFWGGDAAAADRASRVFARVQGLLGPEHVVTPVPQGGRTPAERVRWVPWEKRENPNRAGRLPRISLGPAVRPSRPIGRGRRPLPRRRFRRGPVRCRVRLRRGCSYRRHPPSCSTKWAGRSPCRVAVKHRRPPRSCVPRALPGDGGAITAWAGPWAQDVRWWDRRGWARRVHWQVVVGEVACLVRVERGETVIDALYD